MNREDDHRIAYAEKPTFHLHIESLCGTHWMQEFWYPRVGYVENARNSSIARVLHYYNICFWECGLNTTTGSQHLSCNSLQDWLWTAHNYHNRVHRSTTTVKTSQSKNGLNFHKVLHCKKQTKYIFHFVPSYDQMIYLQAQKRWNHIRVHIHIHGRVFF